MRTDTALTPSTIHLKDYLPPLYLVEQVNLDFFIADGVTTVRSTAIYKLNPERDVKAPCDLMLNGEHMELVSVAVDGVELPENTYEINEHSLTIKNAPEKFSLEVTTRFDPAKNTALEGLYKSADTYCTQCEAEGFRRITYYQDRPDVMAPFTTRIEADKKSCPVLLSNGNLIDSGELEDGRHFTVWEDPFPKPCYLFALVAGPLEHIQDSFTTMSGREVDLRIYVRDGDQDQCQFAMESLKKSMKWDEEAYGREYHLDRFNIVAVSDFNMGAMENTSLNVFNTALVLANPETATDVDFYHVEAVIGHEYFHNWTGNRVTCRDWFQLSLKEGLTVYREHSFSAAMNSPAAQRIDDVKALRSMQFPEDSGPLAHPVRPDHYIEINNFYTMTVYEKGAEVVQMQATLLGEETYRKATDLYFERHDGQAVTVDDFVTCMQDASGHDLSQFKLWYSQAGTPEVTAETDYDADKKQFTITLSQHIPDTPGQTNKKPFFIPVAVGLLNDNGDEILPTQILHLKDKQENFVFDNIATRPVASILRDFSAPVRLATDHSEDDLRFLMVHDTDGFTRWDSAQTLTLRLINRMIDSAEAGHMAVTDHAWLETMASLLRQVVDGGQDLAVLSRMMALPDFSIISQGRSVIEPDHIHAVCEKIKHDVMESCGDLLLEAYETVNITKPYSPDPVSMAERSMKAVLLSYLTCRADHEAVYIARKLYDEATNMTDRMMAIGALAQTASPQREEALADFYERFRKYELVIDKWFRVQAGAVRPSTIEDVRELAKHKDFTMTNPNRVRALFGAFAMRNPVMFHKADGSGYELFGELVKQLDPINPQITARLLTAFETWRRYSPDRQSKIEKVLREVLAQDGLSPNSFEIASKILGSTE